MYKETCLKRIPFQYKLTMQVLNVFTYRFLVQMQTDELQIVFASYVEERGNEVLNHLTNFFAEATKKRQWNLLGSWEPVLQFTTKRNGLNSVKWNRWDMEWDCRLYTFYLCMHFHYVIFIYFLAFKPEVSLKRRQSVNITWRKEWKLLNHQPGTLILVLLQF